MAEVVPYPLLFRFAFPIGRLDAIPKSGKRLLELGREFALPDLSELQRAKPTGELRIAWNDEGLGLSVIVRGKKNEPEADERMPTQGDGLQIWLDTRNTQTIHRASRYCHHFCFSPVGGGLNGEKSFGLQLPIAQAREATPLAAKGSLLVNAELLDDGYHLETWLRREQLQGFDPVANREAGTPTRLGFYFVIRDRELGDQTLSVDDRFPFAFDPSLWATLELTS